jgi:hypothetical protein
VDDNGGDLVGDVFVGSIYHENGAIKDTASRPGGVALAAERMKRNKYRQAWFVPLIFEVEVNNSLRSVDTLAPKARCPSRRRATRRSLCISDTVRLQPTFHHARSTAHYVERVRTRDDRACAHAAADRSADTHEDIVYEVAKFSMTRRASVPLDVQRTRISHPPLECTAAYVSVTVGRRATQPFNDVVPCRCCRYKPDRSRAPRA